MISVPARRVKQFGVEFYQAGLNAKDIDRLVKFEVLGYTGGPDAGGESANSTEASATPQGTQTVAAPTNLTAKGIKNAINLQWVQSTTAGVSSNSVYRRLMNGGTYSSTPLATVSATTSYHDRTVSANTSYCYVVTASSGGATATASPGASP